MRPIAALATLALLGAPASALAAEPGPVRGTYNRGSLDGGARLADEGKHHYLLFPPRCGFASDGDSNAWAHPSVVGAVTDVARALREAFPDAQRLPIGELSAEHGGKLRYHLSHQNGLDVDVWFPTRRRLPDSGLVASAATELLRCDFGPKYEAKDPKTGRWGVTQDFDPELAWAVASRFAARSDVKVIFVGALLKKELARWAKAQGIPASERRRTNAKLYPVFCRAPKGVKIDSYRRNWCPHDDHFHVRFRCPKDSPTCKTR